MNTGLILGLVAAGAYGVWAFFNDKNLWRNKPREVLEQLITGGDWMKIQVALEEVRRRGEDIQAYRPIVLRLLVSASKIERVAGKVAIRKLYPEVARELPDYEGSAPTEVCIAKAQPVLEHFGVLPLACDGSVQPDGATVRNQPVGRETNQKSPPASSGG
jgi:hypothetical protein